ncbi:hypothetical protein Zmor_016334 [Zophobas morio]|jgi:CRP-like cAMP-binding protein|uniref:Uncharacterized protein n=1 Tax=Zophobas morio TaxID=2755281 RepID=A0AA38HHQ9_9CUCU|nr:hypothetical protein Zmor_016334 [Zophobas morio]
MICLCIGVSNLSKEHEILLASLLRFQSYKAGDFIYKENEFSTGLFVLVRGCVGIYKEGSDKSQKLICKFLPGTYFGELSLLTSYIPRTSSAISIEPSVVLKLEGTDFLKFLKLCPEARQAWRESFQKNVIVRITAQLERFNAPFLRGFTREDYESLAQVTQLEYFAPHYEVVKENTDATKFYMIAFGEVNVFVNNEKVGEMGEGHYFGEIGLLHESKRTATVRTKTPCVMLTCNKYNFSKLFAKNPLLEAEFRSRLDPYSLSVENIIYHPKALKCFMEFLKEEFSAENLSFVIDVLDFKAGGVGSAKELIEKYFKGDALNLSDQCRMGTLKAYKQVTGKEDCLELFDEALKEVMMLIGTDSLNRFKSSPQFTRFLTTLQTYTILGGGPSTRRGRFNYDSFGKKSALLGRGTNIRPREHIPTQLANTAIKDERTALSSVGSEIPRVTDRRSVDLQFMEFDSTPSFTSQLS